MPPDRPLVAPPVLRIAGPGTEYRIDPVSLRAVAVDSPAMCRLAKGLLDGVQTGRNASEAAAALSTAAFMLLTAGQPESAERLLRDALRTQVHGPPGPYLASRLRLVQVLQELERTSEAVHEARIVLRTVRSSPELLDLLDFALHHLGKALLQAGDTEGATAALSEALFLREAKGDPSLVESTELALRNAVQAGGRNSEA